MTEITIEAAILCEDIRQEKSNKFILIGVYVGDIYVTTLPAPAPIAIFISGEPTEDSGELWLRLSGPGEGKAKMKMAYKRSPESTNISIASPALEVLLEKEGTLVIERSFDDENWAVLLERKVIQREGLWTLTPIASQPLSEQSQSDAPETSSQP